MMVPARARDCSRTATYARQIHQTMTVLEADLLDPDAHVHDPLTYWPHRRFVFYKVCFSMWERTLQDLIRGLRANKKDEAKFLAKAVDEIRQEIKSEDMELKAGAVLKLTYVRAILNYFTMCIHFLAHAARYDGL